MKIETRIAGRLGLLRKERNLSLDELARLTGVSKSMLNQIEKAKSSPTIGTIWKIALGLKIPFTELIAGSEPRFDLVRFKANPPLSADTPGYRLHPLSPYDPDTGVETYYVEIDSGSFLSSPGHGNGISEILFVIEGQLDLTIGEKAIRVPENSSVKFDASKAHGYSNLSPGRVRLAMVILYRK